MYSHMPPELGDRIIDFLWDSRPDLRACSTVCRQWLPASRHHLFTRVTVRPTLEFLAFLQSASSVVPDHAQTLDFRLWPQEMDAITCRILHQLGHLGNAPLLGNIIFGSFPPTSWEIPIASHITKICFQHTNFPSCTDFAGFLSKFPDLRELELTYMSWTDGGDQAWPEIQLELNHLSLQGLQQNRDILPWLLSPRSPRTRGLSLSLPTQVEPPVLRALSKFIRHLDGHIEYLQFDLFPSQHLEQTMALLKLESLTSLRRLRIGRGLYFSISSVPTTPPICRSFPGVLDIALRLASRNQLAELIFDVEIGPDLSLSKSASDSRLRNILASPGVERVPTVRFHILHGRKPRDEAAEHRRSFASFVRDRGLVSGPRNVLYSDQFRIQTVIYEFDLPWEKSMFEGPNNCPKNV
ncbi:hypothetical protein C8R47DRAFT_1073871 [Mycena vitilis]|nr:hypothetical protein C8R47DRAFT_1073871 [Mycena vitilis]